jgi:hypothetical protein
MPFTPWIASLKLAMTALFDRRKEPGIVVA